MDFDEIYYFTIIVIHWPCQVWSRWNSL